MSATLPTSTACKHPKAELTTTANYDENLKSAILYFIVV
jgi:hypothetical protein